MSEPELAAVIDIGASAIRVIVAERQSDDQWKIIDSAQKPVRLGRDVFLNGLISRESMQQAVTILKGFREILSGYPLQDEKVMVIATSAMREARNRDTFIDRIQLRTGFSVTVVEGIEENRLTYLAVQNAIQEYAGELKKSNSIILEVGGGTTEIMLLQRGKMAAAHSLNIGTVRLEQQLKPAFSTGRYLDRFLSENIHTTLEMLDGELPLKRIRLFIAVGGDARIAARHCGKAVNEHYATIKREDFSSFVESIRMMSVQDRVQHFKIQYATAEALVPGLLVYRQFLEATSAEVVIVPKVSIRDGVLLGFFSEDDVELRKQFKTQVIASAKALGKKYHYDEAHAGHVTSLALSLFDQLKGEHSIDDHGRLLLEVAGILHDVGTYIRTSGHHKHGQYLVANSEIFGLNQEDIRIISNVVRYHRKVMPLSSHPQYASLTREQRILVVKLSAILRVADALDRGHSQHIKNIRLEQHENDIIIRTDKQGDRTLEKYGLRMKGEMFEEVFGYRIILD